MGEDPEEGQLVPGSAYVDNVALSNQCPEGRAGGEGEEGEEAYLGCITGSASMHLRYLSRLGITPFRTPLSLSISVATTAFSQKEVVGMHANQQRL